MGNAVLNWHIFIEVYVSRLILVDVEQPNKHIINDAIIDNIFNYKYYRVF